MSTLSIQKSQSPNSAAPKKKCRPMIDSRPDVGGPDHRNPRYPAISFNPLEKPGPKATVQTKRRGKLKASEPAEARQAIGAAIAEVLGQHGALSAAELAERIKATGRDVTNRTVSFALQASKKRGLAKNTNGKWTAPKARPRNARPSSEAASPKAPEIEKVA